MSHKARIGASLAILVLMLVMAPAVKADPIRITTSADGFELPGLGNNGIGVTNPDFDSLFGFAHSASNLVDSMGGSFTTVLNPLLFTTGFTGFGSGGTTQINFPTADSQWPDTDAEYDRRAHDHRCSRLDRGLRR